MFLVVLEDACPHERCKRSGKTRLLSCNRRILCCRNKLSSPTTSIQVLQKAAGQGQERLLRTETRIIKPKIGVIKMPLANPLPKTRVQLDLSPNEVERMNWMMTVCGLESRKDLFNNALTLLEWAANETAGGRKIASFDDESKERTILSMPVLRAAAVIGPQFVKHERQKETPNVQASPSGHTEASGSTIAVRRVGYVSA